MSLSTAMMASPQPPITVDAMKFILRSTTKRLATLLRLAHVTARADADRVVSARRPPSPPAADLVRIPAYMRRRRLAGRLRNSGMPRGTGGR